MINDYQAVHEPSHRRAMLYLIGLGLGNAEDVTCKGLAVIQRASRVYLEAYTSILTVGTEALVSNGLSLKY